MIGNITLILYISFVVGFATVYIFAGHSEWAWLQKIFSTIVATLVYAIILPIMCGVYMGIQFVEVLKDNK